MDKTLVGKEESVGEVIRSCSGKKVFYKLCQILREVPVLESIFNEVSGLETSLKSLSTGASLLFCKVF